MTAVVVAGLPATSAAAADACPPYSTLECAAVTVATSGAHAVAWDGAAGGYLDAAGRGTGMRMVLPSSNGGAYLPARLRVDPAARTLTIDATKGLQFRTATTGGNNLDNALGVGVPAKGRATTVTTSLIRPSAGTGRFEQAGAWFGPSDDTYVKIVVVSAGSGKSRVQLLREVGGVSRGATADPATNDELNSAALVLSASTVRLRLVSDARAGTVTGQYSVNGAEFVTLGSFSVPATVTDGSLLSPSLVAAGSTGLAGILTSLRTGTTPTSFSFGEFAVSSVVQDVTPPPVPATLTGTAAANGVSVALNWSPSQAPDLAGYAVFRSATSPVPTTGTPLSGAAPVTGTSFTDPTARPGTTYVYAVVARDTSGNSSAAREVTVRTPAVAPPPFALRVDFMPATGTVPAGYVRDYGQAYGPRTAADQGSEQSYGWLGIATKQPISLTKNGRLRTGTLTKDPRLTTFMHMQFTGTASNTTPSFWEVAVPDGIYEVTTAAGEAGNFFDSVHALNVEDQNATARFVPSDEERFSTVTRTVAVSDGRLTITPIGGTNTKIAYVDIAQVPSLTSRPRVSSLAPENAATGLTADVNVAAEVRLPAAGIDAATVTPATVTLTDLRTTEQIPARVNTSGGGDVLVLAPSSLLTIGETYRLDVTSGVKDAAGTPFLPWSSVFTVGAASAATGIPGVAFTPSATTGTGQDFTSVVVGPDRRLYAATLTGSIFRFPIAADGALGTPTEITTIPTREGGPRTVIGLAFDPTSTPANPVLWTTVNLQYVGIDNIPDWTGKIVRLSGPDLSVATDVVVQLPRSARDHETNSLAFGPDGALYLTQGSNTAMGAPDGGWGNRAEQLLAGAVLRLDPAKLPATLPLNVRTAQGGSYDPSAPGAALTIHATGVRNAFDLVWHRNGNLYTPTNGSAAEHPTPGTPATLPASCATRIDAGVNGPWTGPAVAGLPNNPIAEPDYVFRVVAGGYYGHPNPARCEWVLNGGNPTGSPDPKQVSSYPVGVQPDRNYRGDDAYNVGVHASANGAIEYRGSAFGGALDGRLLVVRYSSGKDVIALSTGGPQGRISSMATGITGLGGFTAPLDIAQDISSGSLYVTDLGTRNITRLVPRTP